MSVPPQSQQWVFRPKPNPEAQVRLFCFPYSGGGAAVFRTWADFLPADVELCAVRLPGRETRFRETPFTRLDPLIEATAAGLLPYMDKPFAFFGHSLGALIGYVMALYLRQKQAAQPFHLFVSGRRAPHRPSLHPPVHQADEATFLNRLRNMGGTSPKFFEMPELIEMMMPMLRADFAIWETYEHVEQSPLSCPITAIGSEEDTEAKPADIAAWQCYTNSTFSLHMFSGGHFFWQEQLPQLLALISHDLRLSVRFKNGKETFSSINGR